MRRSLTASLIGILLVAFGSLAATLAVGNSPELGLDLQGGASVVLRPEGDPDSGVIDQAIGIIRNRVDALGVAEPDITRQGGDIVVQLPGVADPDRALEVVGQTAELRFRPVIQPLPPEGEEVPTTTTTAPPEGGTTTTVAGETTTTAIPGDAGTSTTVAGGGIALPADPAAQEQTTTTAAPGDTTATTVPEGTATTVPEETEEPTQPGDIPTTPREEDIADQQVVLPEEQDGEVVLRYLLGPAVATGDIVSTATALFQGNEWVVEVRFTGEGSRIFDEIAAANVGKQLAITLDGRVISAPTINEANFGGTAIISGGPFQEGEARDLALVLRYGALPVELEPQAVQQVSATLGKDSLRAGLLAGAVGTAMVLLYIIVYYRALGLVVVLGLCVWAALQWSVISFLGATQGLALSLAGATGIIVSVGVTVDSYIVYFERLKDEVRSGKSIRSSVDRGFARAFRTILAADAASFIGAALLYWLTVGPVRGFAFFLGLSTLLDVIVAWFFTRPLVGKLARRRVFTEARWLGVARGLGVPTRATAGSPA